MTSPYVVVAIVEAKPGKEAELEAGLQAVVEPTRAEATCLSYHLHRDLNNPAQFFLYEHWESQEAHQAQFEKPYIQELASKLGDLLAKPYQAIFAEEIS